jgi:hypothetical protein
MPSLEYFLICESISTDQETNRISLFNVIEDLQVAPPETAPPETAAQQFAISHFVAVCCWNREPEDEDKEFQATLRIHAPGQQPKDFSMNFTMEHLRHRLSLRFQGIPKTQPGKLRFELLLNGDHVAWHTVNVFSSKSEHSEAATQ